MPEMANNVTKALGIATMPIALLKHSFSNAIHDAARTALLTQKQQLNTHQKKKPNSQMQRTLLNISHTMKHVILQDKQYWLYGRIGVFIIIVFLDYWNYWFLNQCYWFFGFRLPIILHIITNIIGIIGIIAILPISFVLLLLFVFDQYYWYYCFFPIILPILSPISKIRPILLLKYE